MAVGGWDVFVSYGHEDAAWVRAENLHRAGFEVFFDEWELTARDRVIGRLEEGIRGSASGVLVVSPHALSRPWVREEYEADGVPAVPPGEAPSDRGRQRPSRPRCLIPCHPVSPPDRTEPCSYYTFYYSARHAKGPLPDRKRALTCGN